ncbi:MAG TPA: fasciclin domain-containing protein [Sphingomicrobium sp.]|nr:fasciclin domain-containing protein [Sphingomicrobium sp.]
MLKGAVSLGLAGALAALSACGGGDQSGGGNQAAGPAQSGEARQAAGNKTIASGLGQNSQFAAAAKAAGLDATLAGPGPYTVLAPSDAAFAKLPAGAYDTWMKPEARAQLTGVLTYHILPGTVLAADIGKAIENAKGRAVLATMGGGTLTATREGDRIVLTDGAGTRATVTAADQQYSNGVVHQIDAVLMPQKG